MTKGIGTVGHDVTGHLQEEKKPLLQHGAGPGSNSSSLGLTDSETLGTPRTPTKGSEPIPATNRLNMLLDFGGEPKSKIVPQAELFFDYAKADIENFNKTLSGTDVSIVGQRIEHLRNCSYNLDRALGHQDKNTEWGKIFVTKKTQAEEVKKDLETEWDALMNPRFSTDESNNYETEFKTKINSIIDQASSTEEGVESQQKNIAKIPAYLTGDPRAWQPIGLKEGSVFASLKSWLTWTTAETSVHEAMRAACEAPLKEAQEIGAQILLEGVQTSILKDLASDLEGYDEQIAKLRNSVEKLVAYKTKLEAARTNLRALGENADAILMIDTIDKEIVKAENQKISIDAYLALEKADNVQTARVNARAFAGPEIISTIKDAITKKMMILSGQKLERLKQNKKRHKEIFDKAVQNVYTELIDHHNAEKIIRKFTAAVRSLARVQFLLEDSPEPVALDRKRNLWTVEHGVEDYTASELSEADKTKIAGELAELAKTRASETTLDNAEATQETQNAVKEISAVPAIFSVRVADLETAGSSAGPVPERAISVANSGVSAEESSPSEGFPTGMAAGSEDMAGIAEEILLQVLQETQFQNALITLAAQDSTMQPQVGELIGIKNLGNLNIAETADALKARLPILKDEVVDDFVVVNPERLLLRQQIVDQLDLAKDISGRIQTERTPKQIENDKLRILLAINKAKKTEEISEEVNKQKSLLIKDRQAFTDYARKSLNTRAAQEICDILAKPVLAIGDIKRLARLVSDENERVTEPDSEYKKILSALTTTLEKLKTSIDGLDHIEKQFRYIDETERPLKTTEDYKRIFLEVKAARASAIERDNKAIDHLQESEKQLERVSNDLVVFEDIRLSLEERRKKQVSELTNDLTKQAVQNAAKTTLDSYGSLESAPTVKSVEGQIQTLLNDRAILTPERSNQLINLMESTEATKSKYAKFLTAAEEIRKTLAKISHIDEQIKYIDLNEQASIKDHEEGCRRRHLYQQERVAIEIESNNLRVFWLIKQRGQIDRQIQNNVGLNSEIDYLKSKKAELEQEIRVLNQGYRASTFKLQQLQQQENTRRDEAAEKVKKQSNWTNLLKSAVGWLFNSGDRVEIDFQEIAMKRQLALNGMTSQGEALRKLADSTKEALKTEFNAGFTGRDPKKWPATIKDAISKLEKWCFANPREAQRLAGNIQHAVNALNNKGFVTTFWNRGTTENMVGQYLQSSKDVDPDDWSTETMPPEIIALLNIADWAPEGAHVVQALSGSSAAGMVGAGIAATCGLGFLTATAVTASLGLFQAKAERTAAKAVTQHPEAELAINVVFHGISGSSNPKEFLVESAKYLAARKGLEAIGSVRKSGIGGFFRKYVKEPFSNLTDWWKAASGKERAYRIVTEAVVPVLLGAGLAAAIVFTGGIAVIPIITAIFMGGGLAGVGNYAQRTWTKLSGKYHDTQRKVQRAKDIRRAQIRENDITTKTKTEENIMASLKAHHVSESQRTQMLLESRSMAIVAAEQQKNKEDLRKEFRAKIALGIMQQNSGIDQDILNSEVDNVIEKIEKELNPQV